MYVILLTHKIKTCNPLVEYVLSKRWDGCANFHCIPIQENENSFLILKNNTTVGDRDDDMVIDVINNTCTCGIWQEYYQYPCIHAMGWLRIYRKMEFEEIIEHYVSILYKNSTQIEITKQNINPVIISNLVKDINVLPPRNTGTNLAGRPKTKRIRNRIVHPEQRKKKIARCSKCGQEGHYASTCEARKERNLKKR